MQIFSQLVSENLAYIAGIEINETQLYHQPCETYIKGPRLAELLHWPNYIPRAKILDAKLKGLLPTP